MLIVVVERNGSSPGVVGFKMAVSETGSMKGSIGGGVMEYNMVELAKKELKKTDIKSFIKKQIHNVDAGSEKSGLICSGEQTHAFVPIDKSNYKSINDIVIKLDIGDNVALQINPNGLTFNENQTINEIVFDYNFEKEWLYQEQIGLKNTLYIFGAGHVSLPVSQVFRVLDFKVVVLDNRKGLSSFENNMFAHRKKIIDYKSIGKIVEEGKNTYAIIMTVGHKSDEIVLKQLITKNLKYLGMIGSKNKVKNIFDSLRNQGISEVELNKVDAPIGLSINSKTTAEIAISIAAKVIQIKNSI